MSWTRSLRLALAALPLIGALAPQPAFAWNAYGHEVIAWIAEKDLRARLIADYGPTLGAKYWLVLQDLISSDPWVTQYQTQVQPGKWHLADVATWADWLRGDNDADGIADTDDNVDHSVRLPLTSVTVPAHPCTEPSTKRCADDAVTFYAAKIARLNSLSADERREALKYVVHLVGDLHQPLHGSDPIGYNYVYLPNQPGDFTVPDAWILDPVEYDKVNPHHYWQIHSVWDRNIINDRAIAKGWVHNFALFADDVSAQIGTGVRVDGAPRDWAVESREWARVSIYQDQGYVTLPICGGQGNPSCDIEHRTTLDYNYTTRKYPIVAMRLQQAGLRLSCVLYKALTTKDPCNVPTG